MFWRLWIVEEPEYRAGGLEILPAFGRACHCKNGAGRHIVHINRREGIYEGGDAGVVRKDRDGIGFFIQAGDDIFKDINRGVIEFGDELDGGFLFPVFAEEGFGGLPGSFGRAGNEQIDVGAGLDQALGHDGGIVPSPIVEGAVNIADGGIVPTAFCVSYYQ